MSSSRHLHTTAHTEATPLAITCVGSLKKGTLLAYHTVLLSWHKHPPPVATQCSASADQSMHCTSLAPCADCMRATGALPERASQNSSCARFGSAVGCKQKMAWKPRVLFHHCSHCTRLPPKLQITHGTK